MRTILLAYGLGTFLVAIGWLISWRKEWRKDIHTNRDVVSAAAAAALVGACWPPVLVAVLILWVVYMAEWAWTGRSR